MAIANYHQSQVGSPNDKPCSSKSAHHTAIKIDLKEIRRWGLLENKHPMGSCMNLSGVSGIQSSHGQIN